MDVTPDQALSWRLGRQYLVDGAATVAEVVGRLTAVPAWLGDAEVAVGCRLARPTAGAVARAVAAGELIHTYAFRGSRQLMTPPDAGAVLALRAVNRQWELPSWQAHYDLRPEDRPAFVPPRGRRSSTARSTARRSSNGSPRTHRCATSVSG